VRDARQHRIRVRVAIELIELCRPVAFAIAQKSRVFPAQAEIAGAGELVDLLRTPGRVGQDLGTLVEQVREIKTGGNPARADFHVTVYAVLDAFRGGAARVEPAQVHRGEPAGSIAD